jgi:hypothetical protein
VQRPAPSAFGDLGFRGSGLGARDIGVTAMKAW